MPHTSNYQKDKLLSHMVESCIPTSARWDRKLRMMKLVKQANEAACHDKGTYVVKSHAKSPPAESEPSA